MRPDRPRGGLASLQLALDELTPEEKLSLLGGWVGLEELAKELYRRARSEAERDLVVSCAEDVHRATLELQSKDYELTQVLTHEVRMKEALADAVKNHGLSGVAELRQYVRLGWGIPFSERPGPLRLLARGASKTHYVKWDDYYKHFSRMCGYSSALGDFTVGTLTREDPNHCKNCMAPTQVENSCGPA
jgi:hypothetical protein